MDKEWMDSEDDIAVERPDSHSDEESDDSLEGLEINAAIISDTLKRLCEKSKKQKVTNLDGINYLDELGSAAKKFILDNIMYIDYTDMAKLVGLKPDVLKQALSMMGIKVPVQGARRWQDIDVGTFESTEECSRCPVQMEHSTFSVGINDCRKCYEENICYWVEEGEMVNIRFGGDE